MAKRRKAPEVAAQVARALKALERKGRRRNVEGMARYGIVSEAILGVTVADIRALAKSMDRDHALALALWRTGVYEARLLATLVDEPHAVTAAQMDRWCRDFDNWALCDGACMNLFDKSDHAFAKVREWSRREREFEKRAAFALIAALAAHRKDTPDAAFSPFLKLIERAASDERNFVKKAISWALRGLGARAGLHAEALALAKRLVASDDRARRWVGKDALRELERPRRVRR